MNNNSESIELRVEELKELVRCCPLGHNFLDLNCPIICIRNLDDGNLDKIFSGMSEDEIDEILDYHKICKKVVVNAPH